MKYYASVKKNKKELCVRTEISKDSVKQKKQKKTTKKQCIQSAMFYVR